MSAICGILNIDGSDVSTEKSLKMMDKLKIYPFDKIGKWSKKEIFLGCGMQHITLESQKEMLPLYDKNFGISITADAIIDNREELFNIFDISKELWSGITDSDIILMTYNKWGQDCPKHLVGDFAFAIWDENKKELFCTRDHVGFRTFYYYYSKDVFAFCTVIKPLFSVNNKNIGLNERWITDYLALEGIHHEFECSGTIYTDIYQLEPANNITINASGIKKNQYWNPLDGLKTLNLKSDKEYEEVFRKVFFEAVSCRLRSVDEVGIMLSGGLDSGSIACVAADKLLKQNKKLKAFSSIPILEFKDEKPSSYYVKNESDNIDTICNHVGNIDVHFCRCEGKNSVTNMEYFINVFEQPYKIFQTLYWYNEIIEKAYQVRCKVLLNGQFGNNTISDGEFLVHALTLYKTGRILTLIKEIRSFARVKNISSYRVGKVVTKAVIPFRLRKTISKIKNRDYDPFAEVPVNTKLVKKWNVEKRFNEKYFNQITDKYLDLYESRKYTIDPLAFSHIGAIETKLSLTKGMVIRDPTRDKRVIEFCLSMPSEQFVRNGNERYLIRRAMNGILPDKIRLNTSTRGLQSADWIQRLEPQWKDIYDELEQILEDENIQPYLDCEKIKTQLIELKNKLSIEKVPSIRMLLITLIFSRFLKSYNI